MHADEPAATNRETVLFDYASAPERLAAAVAGLSDEQLGLSCPETEVGRWTIRQIAHHIADGDDLWKAPVKIALGRPPAVFTLEWYWSRPQDDWTSAWGYGLRGIGPSLNLFRANRQHIVQLLEEIPGAWDCAVKVRWRDGTVEPVTAGEMVGMQARHASGHIADILRIRQQHGI